MIERLRGRLARGAVEGGGLDALIDEGGQPSLRREQLESLHELGFVERRENVILLGPPGVGKSHLAISLAIAALSALADQHSGLRAWALEGSGGYGAGLARFLRWRGFAAITLGHVIVANRPLSDGLLAHELEHVAQHERWGPLYYPAYLAASVLGYKRNPFERAATRLAGTALDARQPRPDRGH